MFHFSTAPNAVRARLTATQLSAVTANHTLTLNGTLLLTAVSAASVRLDLDADNNGSFESSETVGWDWFL